MTHDSSAHAEDSDAAPRLMAGVRSILELEAAILGGADLVDLRVPCTDAAGADAQLIREMASYARFRRPRVGVSLQLGELCDLPAQPFPLQVPENVTWVRWGLSGCQVQPEWRGHWLRRRAALEAASGQQFKWLMVVNANYQQEQAPSPHEIIDAALALECAGISLEMSATSAAQLTDVMSPIALLDLFQRTRELRLPLFVSNGIPREDLDWVCDLDPLVIGTAVAAPKMARQLAMTAQHIDAFKEALVDSVLS